MRQDLFTSQTHIKRILAGFANPGVTPLPVTANKIVDPSFVGGLGKLNEDEKGRLQCPLRGCGQWHVQLTQHIRWRHPSVNVAELKEALGYSRNVGWESPATRARRIASAKARPKESWRHLRAERSVSQTPRARKIAISQRNWADTCPQQLQDRIVVLEKKIGRTPSRRDFVNEYGSGLMRSVYTVFGSWNNAKAVCGLSKLGVGDGAAAREWRPSPNRDAVMLALKTWHDTHGSFPSVPDTERPTRAPRIPAYRTILRALGVDTWDAARRTFDEYYRQPEKKAS